MNEDSDSQDRRHDEQWMQDTNLVRKWAAIKKEINDHKWYESEKAGHDIGWDRAAIDWMMHHGMEPDSGSAE